MNIDLTKGIYRRVYSGGLRDGTRLNNVSVGAAYWFIQIHAACDDFGNVRWHDRLLLADAAPRRTSRDTSTHPITLAQVRGWMAELVAVGLVETYDVRGDTYGHIVGFDHNQPAGKNGRRYQRHPLHPGAVVNPGESGCIRGNPGESRSDGANPVRPTSQNQTHSQKQTHTQNQNQTHAEKIQAADAALAGPEVSGFASLAGGWPGNTGKRGALIRLGVQMPVLPELVADERVTPAIVAKVTEQQRRQMGKGRMRSPGAWAVGAIRAEVDRAVEDAPRQPRLHGVPEGTPEIGRPTGQRRGLSGHASERGGA